jgi:gamma-glutamylputrescine oxidase
MIATEPLGERRAADLIPCGHAVADVNFVLNYYRRSPDHRLLFGGGVSYSALDRPDLKRLLRRTMLRYFPQLADARIDHCWGGNVAITMNRTPHFGRIGGNVFFAHGYSGHGVALTGLAGKLIAEAVSGTAERFDVFARLPHASFPGGVARTPLLVLAMTWFRLRDML